MNKPQGQVLCILMTITCGISYLLYGYDQGFMSGVLLAEDYLQTMDQPSTFMQGLLSSLYTLGCFFGCVGSISFSEKIGRKKPILIGTVLISIGAVIQTAAYSPAQFIVGRIVSGMGTGLNTSVIPVWQAETLPAKKRERFGAIQYVLVCTGTTISYWMAYALSYSANSVFQWRFLVAAQLVFAVLIMCLVPLMPESPRWHFVHGYRDKALYTLMRMHGTSDEQQSEVQAEVHLIQQAVELEARHGATKWVDLFKNEPRTQNFRRLMLGWWLMFMVMWSGVCSIGYYISYLFEVSVGLSHNLSLLLSGFNGLWYLLSAFIPFFVINHLGKRRCMMISAAGMGCCFLTMSLTIRSGTFAASIVCIIAFFLYYTFFALGYLAIPWLYNAEIMPLHLRSQGTALTTSSNWIWNFATVMMTPSLMSQQGWKGYLVFTVFNFCFVPVIYLLYPETTGRRLEEIDAIFYGTSVLVARTEWADKGRFEANPLGGVIQGLEPSQKETQHHVEYVSSNSENCQQVEQCL
ncbi:sugar transporter [Aspergillus piperis CBS 112811]|uniref:Sugar transporter n=1 Tax=Aspergillus piperis CBS 112811 TaxID=1448313 RepID=A0A8G1REE4_9EURO|nr:sugar transporter [Aspergillus piperis CBS 112811]RAH63149.1 sugar transporter [Aspergillus piperis CBS 112811]